MLAVPLAEVLRVHLTSATTGRPLAFLDTADDWRGFYHSYARSLHAFGIRKTDMVMAAFSYGPWIGYWSGFYAAQDLGCLVFPVGGLSTDQRIDALLNYPITVLGCTPSYALFLAETAARKGIDLAKQTQIRITWHTGEPGASIPATRARIEAAFGGQAYDLPGLTEIAAWGFECEARSGLTHVHEDYCYPEVLDEEDRPVGPGGRGELVFTSLYRKAMPLLRYRTRDVVQLADRPCPCGRTLVAFEGGVHARLDDMKKVRGIIVYPRRIEEIVRPHAGRRRVPDRVPAPGRARRHPGAPRPRSRAGRGRAPGAVRARGRRPPRGPGHPRERGGRPSRAPSRAGTTRPGA